MAEGRGFSGRIGSAGLGRNGKSVAVEGVVRRKKPIEIPHRFETCEESLGSVQNNFRRLILEGNVGNAASGSLTAKERHFHVSLS